MRREYESGITELQSELETMQPNMKAVERFDDVSTRYKSSTEEFEKANVRDLALYALLRGSFERRVRVVEQHMGTSFLCAEPSVMS